MIGVLCILNTLAYDDSLSLYNLDWKRGLNS
ncbi:hypothetical protein GGR08_001597 [Bartonella fuyuanensis]|uniref:Uncharacterized protein n=1 Tax=Bartonella fuyuanensis TaxID=1460968 RepID=A0A840E573_9HYPH|nr:hypothetical protein [Bartonella fuyuanensis]